MVPSPKNKLSWLVVLIEQYKGAFTSKMPDILTDYLTFRYCASIKSVYITTPSPGHIFKTGNICWNVIVHEAT